MLKLNHFPAIFRTFCYDVGQKNTWTRNLVDEPRFHWLDSHSNPFAKASRTAATRYFRQHCEWRALEHHT